MCTKPGDVILNVSASAYRATGAWPSPETAADRLIAALEERIANATNDEERTRWQRIRDGFLGAGRDVIVDVAAAMLGGQLGA
jgi:hypothetical protein